LDKKLTEAGHQILVFCWAKKMSLLGRVELDLMAHIPNGEYRTKSAGSKLKAMGVKAGVPDILLPIARNGFNNLWIEMKVADGSVSETQEKWHRMLELNGGYVVVAYGWKNAVAAICGYLGGVWPEIDMEAMEGRLEHG
jgi:hypothetical protein